MIILVKEGKKESDLFFFKSKPENVKMAAAVEGFLSGNLREKIVKSRILMVGAGGIGCELLKNLVLTGFNEIEVVGF